MGFLIDCWPSLRWSLVAKLYVEVSPPQGPLLSSESVPFFASIFPLFPRNAYSGLFMKSKMPGLYWWVVYVVVNFSSQVILFFFCFNFISIHYHTKKQKKNKNYPRKKINYNMYIILKFHCTAQYHPTHFWWSQSQLIKTLVSVDTLLFRTTLAPTALFNLHIQVNVIERVCVIGP